MFFFQIKRDFINRNPKAGDMFFFQIKRDFINRNPKAGERPSKSILVVDFWKIRNEQWKKPSCLTYVGDSTTQLCGTYKQPNGLIGFHQDLALLTTSLWHRLLPYIRCLLMMFEELRVEMNYIVHFVRAILYIYMYTNICIYVCVYVLHYLFWIFFTQ